MKKTYEKPKLYCEDLQPESMLCGCEVRNPSWSDLEMCSYTVEITGFTTFVMFGEDWVNCTSKNTDFEGTDLYYCYYGPVTTIFSS